MGKKIILTNSDYKKLVKIIQVYKDSNRLKSEHLRHLAEELKSASIVDDAELLTDVVSINSTVVFKNLETGQSEMVTIVFPAESSQDGTRISVLSPLGTALIGEQESSITECYAPGGNIRIRVEKIIARHPVIGRVL